MLRRIYLDNSATTPVDPQVVEAMLPFLTEQFGNASSIHFFGQETRAAIDKARHQVANLINARPNELVFTSGGTEANNLAVRGLIEANLKYGDHIITSTIEHPSVKNLCEGLEKKGCSVTYLPVYENGIVSIDDLKAAITENTILVSIMAANNEIGTLQPIVEIGELVTEVRKTGKKIWFHTDAVQAAGKIPIDVEHIKCDLLSISGHKIHAPKGIGTLYIRRGVRLSSQNIGGHQERERRGGTESVANIVAFGKACEIARTDLEKTSSKMQDLRDKFEKEISGRISRLVFNGDSNKRLPNISNISFLGVEGEGLLISLDMRGVAISTGSACSSGSLEPSPVIRALGGNEDVARGAIRFSFSRDNSSEEVNQVLKILPDVVENLRKLSPSYSEMS